MHINNYLFSKIEWPEVEHLQNEAVKNEILHMSDYRILNTPINDLCNYIENKYDISVPNLLEDRISISNTEVDIDVSHERQRYIRDRSKPFYIKGTQIEVNIPFDGDGNIFEVSPNSVSTNLPRASIKNQEIVFSISGLDLNAKSVRDRIDNTITNIKGKLHRLHSLPAQWNSTMFEQSQQLIENRRKKLLADRNLVESLGYPLKVRADQPATFKAPNVIRKIKPTLPPLNEAKFQPEPELSTDDYDHIIEVIENMAKVMERSPTAFINMGEEALRTHFLVQLNGHYEGQATGETFNYEGKTDILIRSNGKNIFIGECKFWNGPKQLLNTIDQILSYSSWRDTKVAVLIFNRTKNFSKVLKSITEIVKGHNNYKKYIGQKSETHFRFVFSNLNDPNKEIILSVLLFDIPK